MCLNNIMYLATGSRVIVYDFNWALLHFSRKSGKHLAQHMKTNKRKHSGQFSLTDSVALLKSES